MFLTSGHNDTERVHGPNNTVTRRFQMGEVLPRAGNGRWMRRNRNWKENCTSEQFGRRVVSDGGTVCLLGLWGAEREPDWLAPTHTHLVSCGRKSPRFIHLGFHILLFSLVAARPATSSSVGTACFFLSVFILCCYCWGCRLLFL